MGAELIVIGSSLGGLRALGIMLSRLPADFSLPVAIVQHFSKGADDSLCSLLQESSRLPVATVEDKMPIRPGRVYIAPADYHLLVERGHFALSLDAPVGYSRPSIDVFFESAALAYGAGVIAVVLTGANKDGAAGAQQIKQAGGRVLVQDPATAECPIMPAATREAVAVDQILPLEEIAGALAVLSRR